MQSSNMLWYCSDVFFAMCAGSEFQKYLIVKDTSFIKHQSMNVAGNLLEFNRPLTMGILNITDDSFYSGSRLTGAQAIIERAQQMLDEGADILDIGAYSSRPGAKDVDEETETKKLIEAISDIRTLFPKVIISADTFRSKVARAAVAAGANIINDVGAAQMDSNMISTMAKLGVPYILMHNRGTADAIHVKDAYTDIVDDVVLELSAKIQKLKAAGVKDIIVDPGFGFSKNVDQNFELLNRLEELQIFDLPLLAGVSRKRMIHKTLNSTAEKALNGTTALHMVCLEKGAKILRVHDVAAAKEVITLWCKLHESN